jgi:outer membrane lipoprotein LolB
VKRTAKRAAWAAALLLAAVLAAACAQLETRPPETPEFELSARLAARHRDETFSGNIAWRHAAGSDEMLITSPLGQGVARIVREGDSLLLTTAEPKEYRAADAESLTEQALGFRLPLSGLAEWIRGRPAAKLPVSRMDRYPDGRLSSLEQGGWTIDYLEYAGERPARMRLLYPGGIELRLAISQWK